MPRIGYPAVTQRSKVIGQRIRTWRKEAKLTLAAVGASAHVHLGTLSKIERGESPLTIEVAERILAALGRSLPELYRPEPKAAQ